MKLGLGRFQELGYGVMRIVIAFLYACHGLQKLVGAFGGHQVSLGSLFGAAAVIETVFGALILVGFLTSWAAFIASGEMAVAYFRAHAPRGGLPIQNGGELAVAFCFVFLYIAMRGGGRWSVDGRAGG
jgi:putative oxidoreductase